MKRVVISGVGIISNFGTNKETFLANLASEDVKELFSEEKLHQHLDEVRETLSWQRYDLSDWRLMDELSRLGVAAALLAVSDTGIDFTGMDREQFGIFLGTVFGCVESNFKFHQKLLTSSPRYVSRTTFANTVSNAAVGQIGLILGAKGMHLTSASGGVYPFIYGIQQIRAGRVRQALVGGMEKLNPLVLEGLKQYGYLSASLQQGYEGFIAQNGAGAFVVESLADCEGRNGTVLAEIVSYGAGADFSATMREAVRRANISVNEISLVILNENGSKWDIEEKEAVQELFGSAGNMPGLYPVKRQIGETFGAGLAFSVIAALGKIDVNGVIMVNSASFDSRSKGTFLLKKYRSDQEE